MKNLSKILSEIRTKYFTQNYVQNNLRNKFCINCNQPFSIHLRNYLNHGSYLCPDFTEGTDIKYPSQWFKDGCSTKIRLSLIDSIEEEKIPRFCFKPKI